MTSNRIKINRAQVVTLRAAVVAERLGYDSEAALTLGKTVAGLNAQSKGQRLGIYGPKEEKETEAGAERERAPGELIFIELMGRSVPATHTKDGLRALNKDKPVDPRSVQRYLDKLGAVTGPSLRILRPSYQIRNSARTLTRRAPPCRRWPDR